MDDKRIIFRAAKENTDIENWILYRHIVNGSDNMAFIFELDSAR
jgi:hypothetical protein